MLFDNKFYLSLNDPRAKIGYVPIPKNTALEYNSTNPLTALIEDKGGYVVHYGNKVLTKLIPEYFNYSDIESSVKIEADGVLKEISLGSKVNVEENIKVISRPNIRVNIIGYNSKLKDESGIIVNKKDIIRSYSIDKKGKIFRIELYEQKDGTEDKFIGMFLVEFAMLDLPNNRVLS
nr:M99 family metallo-carboxypeptidase C-terminal domain-containing protein [Campylobacter hyointestinalis]